MAKEIDPKQTKRAPAFELWMKAPMPMVTLFKTLDVTRLVRVSRKSGCKFHMLMCWCIGKAAARREALCLKIACDISPKAEKDCCKNLCRD